MTALPRQRFAKEWIQLPLVEVTATGSRLGVAAIRLTKAQEADIMIAKIRRMATTDTSALRLAVLPGPVPRDIIVLRVMARPPQPTATPQ